MVEVTTTVELDCVGESNGFSKVTSGHEFSLLLKQVVQVVDVGAMMLAIMEVNGETTHDGLKGSHLVGELLESDAGSLSDGAAQVFLNQVVDHLASFF